MLKKSKNLDFLFVSTLDITDKKVITPLRVLIKESLKNYFLNLNGQKIENLYTLTLCEIEKPLLDIVMQYTRGNQTRAAHMLGINRGTLLRKLKKYSMYK